MAGGLHTFGMGQDVKGKTTPIYGIPGAYRAGQKEP
jgi:hypothetical protein